MQQLLQSSTIGLLLKWHHDGHEDGDGDDLRRKRVIQKPSPWIQREEDCGMALGFQEIGRHYSSSFVSSILPFDFETKPEHGHEK